MPRSCGCADDISDNGATGRPRQTDDSIHFKHREWTFIAE